jgi:putative ABC transport system permease protein
MLKPSLDQLIKSSFKSILKNKVRTILTSLGIIIGVTSVILLVSIGNGLKAYISDQFESLGTNLVFISPGKVFNSEGGFNQNADRTTITFEQKDVNELRRQVKEADSVIPYATTYVSAKFGKTIKDTSILAVPAEYARARKKYPSKGNGRWFTNEEDEKKAKVVVLGNKIANDLFGSQKPLNRQIIINGKNLKVIGVMDKVGGGGFGGPDFDSYIFLPLQTGFSIIGNEKIQSIQLAVNDGNKVEAAKKSIEAVMIKNYEENDFSIFDQTELLSSINSILNTLTIALSGIAAISLVVGGIGIMNIMLVSVTERTKEIGLRKAIGAYPRAILLQFLIEAIILSAIGGGVGIILGSLGTLVIGNFFPAKVTLESILIAFGVSSAVGIVFGVAPARRASKLSPIEALRYE